MANGWAIHRLAIGQPVSEPADGFPANQVHYHSSEISWSRVVPVGRGTGLGTIKIWQADLATRMNGVHLNELRLAPICDSHNTMLPAHLSAI